MARERQIEFPPQQTHVRWLTPAMLLGSLACIVIVVIILLAHPSGEFIGPF
ncbi:MAG: hypothetical protein ACRDMU_09305 [Gaiellaceae bacterium]